MRFLFRWAFRLFLVIVVLVVALVLLKDTIVRSVAEHRIQSETGLDTKLGKFEISLTSPRVTLENLVLYNTAEFGGGPLIDLPELHIECDTEALMARKLKLKLLRFNLNEVNIVESKDGKTNIVSLMERVQKETKKGEKDQVDLGGLEFAGIDTLNLSLGKVNYISLRKPENDKQVNFDLKNEIITDVKSYADLSGLILKMAIRKGIMFMAGPARPAPASTPPKGGGGGSADKPPQSTAKSAKK